MYPFKSRNTYDRLYPLPSPTAIFELDSKALIDQKLNEFSTQYAHKDFSKTKLPDENPITDMKADTKSPRKKQNKANTMLINKKVQFTEEAKEKNESLTEEEKLWSLLEEKIKSNLKKKDKENPLVRYFKNPLIAAVIESLIVKTIESTFKLKLNLDSSDEIVPPNLIKLFNISPIAISTMSSKTEKLNYVNNCMVKNIDDALDHLMQKAENQEKKILEFTTRFEENKRIGDKNQKDVFEWLQIKTKYEFLKKRLRTSILEKLNYFENQQLISNSLNASNRYSFPHANSNSTFNKISLLKVPQLSTETILKDMNSNFKLITRRAHYLKRAPSPSEPGPILLDSTPEYHWDSLKEDLLKSKRKQAKNLYNEEVKCSNFLNIAFLPLVQETYLTEKKLNNREIKLNRFAEGELLSQEELKFLADTSSLLNRCVDRKFLQDSINIISPDILENLELVLSENIIMNYENLRNTIKKARLDYLKEVNEIKHSKIHEKTEDIARNEAKQRRIKENQKFRKTLDNICWKMERQGCFSPKNKPNSQALAKIFIKKLKRSSLSKKNSLTEIEAPKLNPEDYSKESQKKLQIKRRKYHPSSKLFLQEHNSNEEEDLSNFEQLKSKSNLKEVSKFNLTIHTTSLYKNPFQFRNFYSGGPNPITTCSESFLEHNDKKKPFIGTPNEIKNAILIQKHTRRYLAQLKLRSMREDNPPNHILERIQYNIRDNKTGNRFFNSIQSCKNLLAGSKNKDSKPGFFIPEVINNTKKLKNQLISSSKGHSKPKNTTMFTSISTRNFSTQNSITSQDFLRKNPQESFQATGGLLKHRKLIEYTKNGTFQAMKNLGFSFTKGDANCKDELGNSPLFYASERGLLDFCDFLLRLGANPNERCSERNTPVHMAFKSGKMELVSLMMKHGGDLRLKNKEGNSPRKLGTGRVMKEFDLKIMVSFG